MKQVAGGAMSAYVVVLEEGEEGEEAFYALSDLAARQQFSAAQVTAVGASEHAVVGWFDRFASDYRRITIGQQCEVLSLVGDIALGPDDGSGSGHPGQPQPHLHTVLRLADGTTRGSHLLEGRVWPTLEVVIREAPAELRKTLRPDVGLALIDLDRS